jgi:hypothetical protein
MPGRCEIVEVRHLADATGYACPKVASQHCSDCGSSLCDEHAESCDLCDEVFCSVCLSFHQEQAHAKPTSRVAPENSGEKRSA